MNPLSEFTEALNKQNDILGKARNDYLIMEAERKNFEARLVRDSRGKSHAERVIEAQATEKWLIFHKELARLEAILEFQKLKYQILDKEWLAQHLSLKLDASTIRRQTD